MHSTVIIYFSIFQNDQHYKSSKSTPSVVIKRCYIIIGYIPHTAYFSSVTSVFCNKVYTSGHLFVFCICDYVVGCVCSVVLLFISHIEVKSLSDFLSLTYFVCIIPLGHSCCKWNCLFLTYFGLHYTL